ncbi:M12 family metallopeptidase [Flavivirga abyssicola]|uniref:M12 family metallopeptidase n=1 Tax=Flavivirga abyssicola TaxID=3063533 RepID=UPI0026E10465|nr:M12 family metallopeptidase [Flavivirga sp. MEBiC07777]WVK12542.1 M12 family metallopeptidase [Flavivirga sp. MEBiC07777]
MKTTIFLKKIKISLFAFILVFASCEDNESIAEPVNETTTTDQEFIEKYFLGEPVKVKKEEDGTFSLQGTDIRLFEEQLTDTKVTFDNNEAPSLEPTNKSKLGLASGIRKWSNNTIVYVIQGLSESVKSELQKSIKEWESKTNIKFKERTNESTYVTISSNGNSCNCGVATLGANGSRGFIRLGTRTTAVVIIHEIGHTLGYIHEQNRSDRDDHIIINYENITENAKDQFFKSTSAILVTKDFDIKSTMMYGSYTFSKNGKPTITDLNGNVLPRRKAQISALDIEGTNSVYPSDTNPPNPSDPCDGIEAWSSSTRYSVGDKVTYSGYLFERDFIRWNQIAKCGNN